MRGIGVVGMHRTPTPRPVSVQRESSGSIVRVVVTLGIIVAAVLAGHPVSGEPSALVPSPPAQAAAPPPLPVAIPTPNPASVAPVDSRGSSPTATDRLLVGRAARSGTAR